VTGCGKDLGKVYNLARVCGVAGRFCAACAASLLVRAHPGPVNSYEAAERSVTQLRALLHPREMRAKLAEWTRGGLPSDSFGGGSPSAERPVVKLDRSDEWAFRVLTEYDACLIAGTIARLTHAVELETSVIPEYHLTPTALADLHQRLARKAVLQVSSRAVDCANCGRQILCTPSDMPRAGRCVACYGYRRRTGGERPRELWDREDERRLAVSA
jgi:hypothetical protein